MPDRLDKFSAAVSGIWGGDMKPEVSASLLVDAILVLQQVEWAGQDYPSCPDCLGKMPKHRDGCGLAEVLSRATGTK